MYLKDDDSKLLQEMFIWSGFLTQFYYQIFEKESSQQILLNHKMQ